MDDETSRSLTSSSRFTDDLFKSEKVRLETQLQDAQSEVYQLRRMMPFLENTNPDNPSQTFRTMAVECADLRDERDRLQQEIEGLQLSRREELQQKDHTIEELRRELEQSHEERDRYKRKCQEYERELSNEESMFYQQQINEDKEGRPELPFTQLNLSNAEKIPEANNNTLGQERNHDRRINFQIDQQASKDSHVRNLYNRMDEENSEISSVASQSNVQNPRHEVNVEANFTLTDSHHPASGHVQQPANPGAEHLGEYINVLRNYRSNVRALYDQMKSTAHFFVDILKRLGYENDPQIQIIMRKINEINLNMQDSKNLSKKVLEDTRQIGAELAELYRSFERRSPNASGNDEADENRRASPSLELMLGQKDNLIAGLRNEKNDLDNECQKLRADFNELQELVTALELRVEDGKNREEECLSELQNRKQLIEILTHQIQQETHEKDLQLAHLKGRLKKALQNSIDNNQVLRKKISEGAAKSAFILPDQLY
ncbi:hypothetical protein M3Y97_00019800 [Aphelenchoides bicaudatus]|nr:hypothetical protein M3Y97_00019800 [Aphelenchoides bicaudatus]